MHLLCSIATSFMEVRLMKEKDRIIITILGITLLLAISVVIPNFSGYVLGILIIGSLIVALLPYLLATLELFHLTWLAVVLLPLIPYAIVNGVLNSIKDPSTKIAVGIVIIIIGIIILYYLGKSIIRDLSRKS